MLEGCELFPDSELRRKKKFENPSVRFLSGLLFSIERLTTFLPGYLVSSSADTLLHNHLANLTKVAANSTCASASLLEI